jgi:uncharacterized RDD family membrane protein YckC
MDENEMEYAGFWIRAGAFMIDSLLFGVISLPLLFWIYGWKYLFTITNSTIAGPADFVISVIFPSATTIAFWFWKQATPGKMLFSAKVVDAISGSPPSIGQIIGRYFAYLVSLAPLGLGFLWIAIDGRKQSWHDKLAGTVVVKRKSVPVKFINVRAQT